MGARLRLYTLTGIDVFCVMIKTVISWLRHSEVERLQLVQDDVVNKHILTLRPKTTHISALLTLRPIMLFCLTTHEYRKCQSSLMY